MHELILGCMVGTRERRKERALDRMKPGAAQVIMHRRGGMLLCCSFNNMWPGTHTRQVRNTFSAL